MSRPTSSRESNGARGPRDSRRPVSPPRPAGPGRNRAYRAHPLAVTALTVLTAFTWLLGIGLLAGCGASGDSGGSGKDSGTSEQGRTTKTEPNKTEPTRTKPPEVTVPKGAAKPATKDVRVTDCEGTPPSKAGVHATVEITNSTDKPWGYSGQIVFKDPKGKQIATGLFAKNTVKPGQKVEATDIPGDTYKRYPDVTCALEGVRRNPPK